MIHELKQLIWLDTPKGLARALLVIDYGVESDLYWVCLGQDKEIWTWENKDVRVTDNQTIGRVARKPSIDELMREKNEGSR